MTASAWVVNPGRDKVLMVYHKIYDSWSWTGGHADGEEDLLAVALREVTEETGVTHVRPVSKDIFSLETVTVDGHEKRGEYVSSHLHLNVTYLLEADDTEPLRVCEDENKGVAWFSLEEALAASTEPWFVKRIYGKLNEKLKTTHSRKMLSSFSTQSETGMVRYSVGLWRITTRSMPALMICRLHMEQLMASLISSPVLASRPTR